MAINRPIISPAPTRLKKSVRIIIEDSTEMSSKLSNTFFTG